MTRHGLVCSAVDCKQCKIGIAHSLVLVGRSALNDAMRLLEECEERERSER
jgi:hypothetical protein